MKIEQLIQVIEVARVQSITLAAKNMYMAQSNLSTSLRELEKEMNQQIFIRSEKGTQLTPFGEAFLTQAKFVVKQFDYIKGMSSRQDKWATKFSVSSFYFLFASYIFLDLFLQNSSRNIVFDFIDCSRGEIINSVSDKTCELGILSLPTSQKSKWLELIHSRELEYHNITVEKAHILVGEHSPFYDNQIQSVRMEDLRHLPLIDFAEPEKVLEGDEQYLDLDGLNPEAVIRVSDRGTLIRFLHDTDCYHIATMNSQAYQDHLFHESIRAVPIEDCPFDFEISWIKSQNSFLSQLGKQFLIKAQELLVLDNPPVFQ